MILRTASLGKIFPVIQSLHLYGALAVSALGWATGILLGFPTAQLIPLWFCGMLGAYNLDRLKHDPADRINVPLRTRRAARLAAVSALLVLGSALTLLLLPLLRGDLPLALLVGLGALCAASYSLPLGMRRLKDLPWLKTLAPPAVVAAAFLLPPALRRELPADPRTAGVAAWLLCLLLANMLICDRRDIPGDRMAGVRTIATALGETATLRLAAALILAASLLALLLAASTPDLRRPWLALALVLPAFSWPVIFAARAPRTEGFYEWLVEGMFLIPPAVVWLVRG